MTLEMILGIIRALTVAIGIGTVGFFLWYKFLRPRQVLRKSKPTNHSGIPKKDVTQMIPVKDISRGTVTLDGENRFIRSIKTTGQDLFLASENEQRRTQAAYQQFLRTIQTPVTFRIDSSACDLSVAIEEHQEALLRTENEYGEAVSQFAMLERQFQDAKTDREKHDALFEMYRADRHVTAYENAIRHLKQQIAFLEAHNGGEKNPIIEQRYIYEWSYNPDDFPQDEDMINKRADNELKALEKSMADALLNAGVKCTSDDTDALFDLSYRHYHPYAGMIYREHNATDYEEKLNRGRAYYDVNLKKYRAVKQDPLILSELEKIKEEEEKKRLAAEEEADEKETPTAAEVVSKADNNDADEEGGVEL